ncbi:MAG TPA: hypothetical protein VMF66_00285 [Candidatus Acidoferrum sp.]|nr:hypothetical protein [Candidatus Acidoferrum sp.]
MATKISGDAADGAIAPGVQPRRHIICTVLWIAALANVLVPAVLYSDAHLFGLTSPGYRAAVSFVVLLEYLIAFLLVLLHANVGFASGYAVSMSAVLTLSSAVLTYITLAPVGWSWSAASIEVLVVCGLAFAILSNLAFFIASVRYARAIHPRVHLGGFFLGIAASVALLVLYTRILS